MRGIHQRSVDRHCSLRDIRKKKVFIVLVSGDAELDNGEFLRVCFVEPPGIYRCQSDPKLPSDDRYFSGRQRS